MGFLFLGLVLALCALSNLYAMLSGGVNADLLHLPLLFKDWASGHLDWFFWSQPPSRYIFPDIPVFFGLNLLTGSGVLAILLNIWLDFFLIFGLLAWALKIYGNVPFKKSLLPLLLGLTLFTLPGLFPDGARWGAFWPSFHAGALWWSLLGYCLLGLWLKRPSWGRAVWVFVVGVLAGFCDPLCFVIFTLPAMATAFLGQSPKQGGRRVVMPLLLFISYLLGGALGNQLMPYAPLQFTHEALPPASLIWQSLGTLFHYVFSLKGLPGVLLYIAALLCLGKVWQKLPRVRWMVIALGVLFIEPLAVALVMGRFTDMEEVRYFSLSLLVATLLVTYLLCEKGPKFFAPVAFVFVVGLSLLQLAKWPSYKALVYPPMVQQLDSLKAPLGLKAGLAEYWTALPIRYFSHEALAVNALGGNYSKDRNERILSKNVNLAWLGVPFTPPPYLDYNFIITLGLNQTSLVKIYGQPSHIYDVVLAQQPTQIWVYDYNLNKVVAEDHMLWEVIMARLDENASMILPIEREIIGTRLIATIRAAIVKDPSHTTEWVKQLLGQTQPK